MVKNQKTIHSSDESNEGKMSQRLESVYGRDMPRITTSQINGLEFIEIVYKEKVSKAFGMITVSGSSIEKIMSMIENRYRLNSITTTYSRGELRTSILIIEGARN